MGRIISLRNCATDTEMVTHPQVSDAWRIIVPTGRHTIGFVLGSQQKPPRIERAEDARGRRITMTYLSLRLGRRLLKVRARFTLVIGANSSEVTCVAEIENRDRIAVDEVEFPVLGGLGGFAAAAKEDGRPRRDGGPPHKGDKREMRLVAFGNLNISGGLGHNYGDVLNRALPETGRESHHFVRENETAMFPVTLAPETDGAEVAHHGMWLDLHNARQGLYAGLHDRQSAFAFKIEKFPKEFCHGARNAWPRAAPRWLRLYALHMPQVAPGGCWTSAPVTLRLHAGDWYAGADFDNAPAPALGGERGFRRMAAKLHRHGIRIMLLDHLHRWINHGLPEYKRLGLERFAVRRHDGALSTARWWKETGLSCLYLRGPTPEWVEMCPACPGWRAHYLRHVERMIGLGADALQLDTFLPRQNCFSKNHPHRPGAALAPLKLDFIREVRERAKRLNPEFALIGETMLPEARAVLDGFYAFRHFDEDGNIHRYLFPDLREQTALVGNYAYDQVNKALQLGIGIETEVWGLRTTALDGCPDLARYIGAVNRFRRRHADIFLRGVFRDTLGAKVEGEAAWSVIEGVNGGKALVLRNSHERAVKVTARLDGARGRMLFWCLLRAERSVSHPPLRFTLPPRGVAVLLAKKECCR